MPRLAILVMLGLAGCVEPETGAEVVDMQGWRFASGKEPTRAEYTAVVAACQDGAVTRATGKPIDTCLAELGLRRAP